MNPIVQDTVAIAIGAIAGAITRYQTGKVVTEYITHHVHPNDVSKQSYYLGWHTAFINITGSFILGAVFATPVSMHTEKSVAPTTIKESSVANTNLSYNIAKCTSVNPSVSSHAPTIIPTAPTIRPTALSTNMASTTTTTAAATVASSTSSSTAFGLTPRLKLLLGVGFCGSYTTFSTYSVDVVSWLLQGQTNKALSYIAINNIGGIAAAAMGMTLMKKLLGTASK